LRWYHPFTTCLFAESPPCGLEFLRAVPGLETVYVPIGLGSGICGMIAAREALGAGTKVVGVVAENAPAYALSFNAGKPIATDSATTIADGVACRGPEPRAVEIINRYAERIVQVSEAEIRAAMRHYFTDTHRGRGRWRRSSCRAAQRARGDPGAPRGSGSNRR
jgi:threonine dehydratase